MTTRARLGSFLMNMNLQEYIAACAQKALQGQIPLPLREYSFAFDEDAKCIWLKAEVDRELNEEERESIAVAETEIYSNFDDDTLVETLIEIVPARESLHPLPDGVVFLREGERTTA